MDGVRYGNVLPRWPIGPTVAGFGLDTETRAA
jgi:hypothetical protein